MKRNLAALEQNRFDVVVVGGGILGACIAWDASLRGLSTALVESVDFGAGVSANSLRIVHGGLRYLQTLDLPRARRSIRERSAWLRIAPHLVRPLPVLVPAVDAGTSRAAVRLAALMADTLGADRNVGLDPEIRLPAGELIGRGRCLDLAPELERWRFRGGVLFHDAQLHNSERLVFEIVAAAAGAGAVVANHAKCVEPILEHGRVAGVRVEDRLSGRRLEVRSRLVVNAAGAGGPVPTLRDPRSGSPIRWSPALNLMVRAPVQRAAFTVSAPRQVAGRIGGRRLFVTPWRDRTICGTAHFTPGADPDPPANEIRGFLDELNAAWGEPRFDVEDVILVQRGRLPAVQIRGDDRVRLLSHHRVLDHAADGLPGLLTALGVKFTTARFLAERTVDALVRRLGRRTPPCATHRTCLPGASGEPTVARMDAARRLHGDRFGEDVLEHLVRTYGVAWERVVAPENRVEGWDTRVAEGAPVVFAELVHAARHEMAATPEDLVDRRTELGALALRDDTVMERAAAALALAQEPTPARSSAATSSPPDAR